MTIRTAFAVGLLSLAVAAPAGAQVSRSTPG